MKVLNNSEIASLIGDYLRPTDNQPTPEPDLSQKIETFQRLIQATDRQVTRLVRPPYIQQLIDECFQKHILAFNEKSYNVTGQDDYYTSDRRLTNNAGLPLYPGELTAREIARKLIADLPENEILEVLDIGTGDGELLVCLKEEFGDRVNVTGLSASDFRTSDNAKKKFTNRQPLRDDQYIIGNVENIDRIPALKGRTFHWVVSATCFQHLSDNLGTIARIYDKYLKKGGLFTTDSFDIPGLHIGKLKESLKPYDVQFLEGLEGYVRLLRIRKTHEHLDLPIIYSPTGSFGCMVNGDRTRSGKAQIFYKFSEELSPASKV